MFTECWASTLGTYTWHHLCTKLVVPLLIAFGQEIVDSGIELHAGIPVTPSKGGPWSTDESCNLRVFVYDHIGTNASRGPFRNQLGYTVMLVLRRTVFTEDLFC